MKLGSSYNLFDGEELLESSINSIRNGVDFISVVYQTQSNQGNPGSEKVTDMLLNMVHDGLIDDVAHYSPDLSKHPHFNELAKRNIGLQLSKEAGCTHHMSIDTDELYDAEQFESAKKLIETGDYDSSACRLLTYYKNTSTVLDPMEDYFVSFIFKIREGIYYDIIKFPVLVDPTRRMPGHKFLEFPVDHLVMHHLSYIRKDLKVKLENSSAKENWNEEMMGKVLHHYSQWQPGMDALMAPATMYATKQVTPQFEMPW